MAVSTYDSQFLSSAGKAQVAKATDLYNVGAEIYKTNPTAGKAIMDNAHKQAEAIRGQSGYSGGTDGSQYITQPGYQKLPYSPQPTQNGYYQQPYQFGSYDGFYQDSGLAQIEAANKAALNAYLEQTRNDVNAQKSTVATDASNLANQAYIQYMLAKNNIAQNLSANGYTGGLADSHLLELETNLQKNQIGILQNRDNTITDLEKTLRNTELQSTIEAARQQADLKTKAVSGWQDYMTQMNNKSRDDYYRMQDLEWDKTQYYTNLASTENDRIMKNRAQARDTVLTLLAKGKLPNETTLAEAGMSLNEALSMVSSLRV